MNSPVPPSFYARAEGFIVEEIDQPIGTLTAILHWPAVFVRAG